MLVLSRKTEQKILIGDSIVITVLKVRGNVVQLGIEAPKTVRVVRGELTPLGSQLDSQTDCGADRVDAANGLSTRQAFVEEEFEDDPNGPPLRRRVRRIFSTPFVVAQ